VTVVKSWHYSSLAGKGYVVAVPVNFAVRLRSGRKAAVSAVAAMVPAAAWETRSCGRGCKGHRTGGRSASRFRRSTDGVTLSDGEGREERAQCRLILSLILRSVRVVMNAQIEVF